MRISLEIIYFDYYVIFYCATILRFFFCILGYFQTFPVMNSTMDILVHVFPVSLYTNLDINLGVEMLVIGYVKLQTVFPKWSHQSIHIPTSSV